MPKKNNNGQNSEEQNPIPQEVEKKSDLDNMFRNAEKTQRTIEDRINNCINMGVTEQKQAKQQSKQPSRGNAGLKM